MARYISGVKKADEGRRRETRREECRAKLPGRARADKAPYVRA